MSPRDAVYAALVKLLRGGRRLQPKTAVNRIEQVAGGLTRLDITEGLSALAAEGQVSGVSPQGRVAGMVGWITPPAERLDSNLVRWKQQLSRFGDEERKVAFGEPPKAVKDLDDDDLETLLSCLFAFDEAKSPGEDRYILSAKSIMGSSKVLDAFPSLLGRAARRRPFFLITAGPATPLSLLFIENPSVFASLLRTPFVQERLIICAFGYGVSMENMGKRLKDGSLVTCSAAGDRITDLAKLIDGCPCFHWGDLDLEGLRIFEGLQSAVPHLRLPAIYRDMARLLGSRMTSHPYVRLFDKRDQRPPQGAEPCVAVLAELCAVRAVDQEALCPVRDYRMLCEPLGIADLEDFREAAEPATHCAPPVGRQSG